MHYQHTESTIVLLVGCTIVAAILIKSLFERIGIPALVGYLLVGLGLRGIGDALGLLSPSVFHAYEFLAMLGIVALLFRVGLHSHPRALLAKLPAASVVWVSNFFIAAAFGFAGAYYLLHLDLVPSLFVAAAMSTTSVGVAVASWEDARALDTDTGQLVLDVAELDDLSGIAFMALLLALAPVLMNGPAEIWTVALSTSGWFAFKLAAYTLACIAFAHLGEPALTRFAGRLHQQPERMLIIAGVGYIIAAIAGWLGFSLAIGAMFAGLVFSNDPATVKAEKSFEDLYTFVTPFFFISLGLHINPLSFTDAIPTGLLLFVLAVSGKVLGAGVGAWFFTGPRRTVLIGLSMVPRAEISLLIIQQARQWSDLLPEKIYAALVLVSALTCLITPLALKPLFKRWDASVRETF